MYFFASVNPEDALSQLQYYGSDKSFAAILARGKDVTNALVFPSAHTL